MNNLPKTLEGLLDLLHKLRDNATAGEYKTIDYDMFAESIDALIDQYDAIPGNNKGVI